MRALSGGLLVVLALVGGVSAQRPSSSAVHMVTVWSDNGAVYLRSVPYDSDLPPSYGRTTVHAADGTELYGFDRAFLSHESSPLFLSNDGEIILAALGWPGADDQVDRFRAVTVYRHGLLIRSFTTADLTGCAPREGCSLTYFNADVIDREKSQWGTRAYRKVLKDGTSDEERFLAEFGAFSAENRVYVTDSKKQVHVFSLESGDRVRSAPFAEMFTGMKAAARPRRTEVVTKESVYPGLPKLSDGRDPIDVLAKMLDMKRAEMWSKRDRDFQLHEFFVGGLLSRDGRLEVKDLDIRSPRLPRALIMDFLASSRFDASAVPEIFGKWYIKEYFVVFRDRNDKVARQEKKDADAVRLQFLKNNATLDRIDGVYIPKNIAECFTELDKMLSEDDRSEMRGVKSRDDMIRYHLTLGMSLRNSWGLWANSRLAAYFIDRGVKHPDDMSGLILRYYYDWLNGRKDAWKEWDKKGAPT